jgi:hypothetical protein
VPGDHFARIGKGFARENVVCLFRPNVFDLWIGPRNVAAGEYGWAFRQMSSANSESDREGPMGGIYGVTKIAIAC